MWWNFLIRRYGSVFGKVLDIYILIPANINQWIVDVVKVVDIGIKIPATLTQVTAEFVDVVQVWPSTITLVIEEDILIEVDIGHKIPDNLPLAIRKHKSFWRERWI